MRMTDDHAEARAADWLARLDQRTLADPAHGEFESWCRADPRNLAAYLRVLAAWNRLDALKAADVRTPERSPRPLRAS
jgi:transmembrane sensor